ncbi:MAG: hypothetical protein ACO29O_08225 [Chitinophagaceae bacterium]
MARFPSQVVFEKIEKNKVLPIFNHADVEICREVMAACYRSGIRAFEMTNRDPKVLDIFKELQPWVKENCPELSFGVGTILDKQSALQFIEAGADFIIAPIFDLATAEVCNSARIPYIPGCLTPSEMHTAYLSGCELVKLFPAETVGPNYIKHILGPLPHLKIVATGGLKFEKSEIEEWFNAGVYALGLGSSVFTKKRIREKDYAAMENDIRVILSQIP